jgi:hypothetical protein
MSGQRSFSQARRSTEDNLDEARRVSAPADNSDFEARHSQPRDPEGGTEPEGPVTGQSSDPGAAEALKEGSEGSTLFGTGPLNQIVSNGARNRDPDHIAFMRYASPPREEGRGHTRILSFTGVGAHPHSTSFKLPLSEGMMNRGTKNTENHNHDGQKHLSHLHYPHYLTRHTIGRNAQFYGLSKAEREHLGGVEYRAIQLLSYVVPIYFVLWQLLGCVGLGAYMAHNKASTFRENGIDPWYVFLQTCFRVSLIRQVGWYL